MRHYGVEVHKYPNGTSTIYHPDISDAEWEKRHKEFEKTCARFMRHVEEQRIKNEKMEKAN